MKTKRMLNETSAKSSNEVPISELKDQPCTDPQKQSGMQPDQHTQFQPSLDQLNNAQKSPSAQPEEVFDDANEYPEGGLKAWLVVLGAWCALASGAGWLNSMGVLMAWISQNQLRDVPESTTAWIFSLYGFALYFCGAQIGPIFDAHDIHLLTIPGSIGMAASIMGLSVSTKFWHFLLSFGILGGISASILFYAGISAVSHWFSKRRSLATGIALSAGGLGGVFYPLIILYLGPAIGFPWAVRVIGFFNIVTGVVGCLLVRKRLPPNKAKGAAIDLKALRDPTYAVVTLASFLLEFTLVTPYTYISTYAIAGGMDPQKAYMLTTILSAAGFPGRIVPNYFADRYGVFNVMILTAFACIASIFGLWLNAHRIGDGAIIAFAVLWGFWSGASIALAPVCIGETCETEDYGKRTGTAFFIASFGALIGPPIAGAILDKSGGDYLGVIIMAGVLYALTAATYFWAGLLVKKGKTRRL